MYILTLMGILSILTTAFYYIDIFKTITGTASVSSSSSVFSTVTISTHSCLIALNLLPPWPPDLPNIKSYPLPCLPTSPPASPPWQTSQCPSKPDSQPWQIRQTAHCPSPPVSVHCRQLSVLHHQLPNHGRQNSVLHH